MPEDQKRSFSEAVETGASAAHTIRGAIKTGKAISSAAKGAAAGGPYGAAAGAVWAGRKHIGKIIVAVIALLMLPVLFVLMLPGLIFGGLTNAFSPSDPEIPILNSETAIIENANEITFTLNGILGEALDDVLARIEADFAASGADHMEVKNAYSGGPIYNANLFISQYCAAKDKDFESISLNDLAATLRENKQHLYSYTSKQEIRESTVTDPETGEETTVSETWMVYTVRYNGESYFSDVVFQLTDDQKELASDYASNLSLFLGDGLLQNLEAWTGNSITALGDVTFTDGITPVVYYNQLDEPKPACLNPVADYLPISKIENGIIYTKDHRYVKIVEVVPINFMLRSAQEQRNIIYSFVSYLKISPIKLQIKVLTRRAEINRHLDTVRKEMEQETNEQCLLMQEDYLQFVQQIGSREAITRRFFLIFEYEPWSNTKRSDEEGEAINALQSAVHTATNYLRQCGNEVIVPENWDEFTVDVLYNLLCRNESAVKPLSVRAQEVVAEYLAKGRDSEIDHIPATEFCAPKSIDFTHGHHICIDGLYYAYLLVPSDGYKTQVPAGWLSLIVNAGDGIDMDMFLSRQPKETIIQKVGQQLRINRSKIKDASDTNTDFDDIDGAIRSGYFLKEGLANNEDFYYLNLLITITASNEEDLEWKVSEMKKLLLSQDMNACTCHFREEQAFLSALPLVAMEKKLYERGKRNLLTGGAASCYPFTSYEMCDDNGRKSHLHR